MDNASGFETGPAPEGQGPAGDTGGGLTDRARRAADRIESKGHDLVADARDRIRDGRERIGPATHRLIDEHPLACLAGGLVAGAILARMIPGKRATLAAASAGQHALAAQVGRLGEDLRGLIKEVYARGEEAGEKAMHRADLARHDLVRAGSRLGQRAKEGMHRAADAAAPVSDRASRLSGRAAERAELLGERAAVAARDAAEAVRRRMEQRRHQRD